MKKLLFAFLFLSQALIISAQNDFIIHKDFLKWDKELSEKKRSTLEFAYDKINRSLEVTAWVVKPEKNRTGYAIEDTTILKFFEAVNDYFAPIGISFVVCNIKRIEDFQLNYLTDTTVHNMEERYDGSDPREHYYNYPYIFDEDYNLIRETYYETNTINVYYTPLLYTKQLNGYAAGMAHLPGGEPKLDVVYISTDSCGVGQECVKTHAHELGHFFGLYHTHEEKLFGSEFVDGSNCATAGDKICDTPAEPDLSEHVITDCKARSMPSDPQGDTYLPNVGNMMSYSPSECRWGFSKEQYERMLMVYYNFKTHLR